MAQAQRIEEEPDWGDGALPGLGPLHLGPLLITPPPGLSEWAAQIDLRPARMEIVEVRGRLDAATGMTTWTVTALA